MYEAIVKLYEVTKMFAKSYKVTIKMWKPITQ